MVSVARLSVDKDLNEVSRYDGWAIYRVTAHWLIETTPLWKMHFQDCYADGNGKNGDLYSFADFWISEELRNASF